MFTSPLILSALVGLEAAPKAPKKELSPEQKAKKAAAAKARRQAKKEA